MVFSFANLKGGVGKSKCNGLFANYLAWRSFNVCLLDLDVNQQTVKSWDSVENPLITHITWDQSFGDLGEYIIGLEETFDVVILDVPGTLQQAGVIKALSLCDLIVCPTSLEVEDTDSTAKFVAMLKESIPDTKMKVMFNNYEVQFFGGSEIENNNFTDYAGEFDCPVLPLGIRKMRSYLNLNFVFGNFESKEDYKKVVGVLDLIYNDLNS